MLALDGSFLVNSNAISYLIIESNFVDFLGLGLLYALKIVLSISLREICFLHLIYNMGIDNHQFS